MKPISGVNVAAITPRGPDGHEADIGATLELIEFLCDAGVHGIALLGSTGEFLHIPMDERERLVHLAVKRSRVPVLAGVSHSSLDGALQLGREAIAAGVEGVLLMPPYFFRYSQEDIQEFYRQFAGQMDKSGRIFLYNIPAFTTEIEFETAAELLCSGRFAGIKDSSGELDYIARLVDLSRERPFTILVGNDVVFTLARKAGAHGVVSGVACAVPELILGLDRAIQNGAAEQVNRLERRLQELIQWLDLFPVPVGVKAATQVRGLKVGALAVPLSVQSRKLLDEFREWFKAWLPVVKREVLD